MLEISKIQIDHREGNIITDQRPTVSFALKSDIQGEKLDHAIISCNDWSVRTEDQLNNIYGGMLLPHTEYELTINAFAKSGESSIAKAQFIIGKLDEPWYGKWIGTAYFANSCAIMTRISSLLNKPEDVKYYEKLRKKIIQAYRNVLTDGKGKLKNEFQSAYVLPLAFKMTEGEETEAMVNNFINLLERQNYEIKAGFPATPYILFALADNGHGQEAYQMLLQKERPGWIYAIEKGATSIWERWDAVKEDGTINLGEGGEDNGGMVSFNHYANGAVGNFLYSRTGGLEPLEGGYRKFRIKPVIGGQIDYCEVCHESPFGTIGSAWKIADGRIRMNITVPVSCECEIVFPSGKCIQAGSGTHEYEELLEENYA